MRARLFACSMLVAAVVVLPPSTTRASEPTDVEGVSEPAPGERGLAARLLAPCCFTQTLDVHDSPLARELRREVRRRLRAGEPVEVVEQNLVDRYGEQSRAVPEHDPMRFVAAALLVAAVLAGALVLRVLRQWNRRAASVAPAPAPPTTAPDEYDARLDAELADLD